MSKTTLLWLVTYFGSWVASAVNPLFGAMGYLFEYYQRPSLHWWGEPLPDLRWNLMISIVLIVTYFLRQHSLAQLKPVANPALKWILALTVLMLLVTPFAADVELSFDKAVQFQKSVVIYLLIIGVVRSQWAFDALVAMHIAGAGWWGYEQWLDPKREQSRLLHVGSSDTLNDNLAAAHLLTVLPLAFVYIVAIKDKRFRALALVCAPFVVNLFILCNSRGGTVGLLVGAVAALLLARSGHRLRMIAAIPVIAAVFFALADPEFIARQQTTANYDSEATAQARLSSWRGGLALIRDHPFGAGGEGYKVLSPRYIPEIVANYDGAERAPHNTFVLVASEWGLLGLIFYVGLLVSTLLALNKVRRLSSPTDGMYYRALALQVGLIATSTAACFSDRLYGESFYWMCGLAIALYKLQHHQLAVAQEAAAPKKRELARSAWARAPSMA